MKKKTVLYIVVGLLIILIIGAWAIDMHLMSNNEPVVFSTWGRKYAPPRHEDKLKSSYLEVDENTVAEIGRGTLKQAVEISEEDANSLSEIINSGSWIEGTADCKSDCVINLKGHMTYYHSDCGTFNKYNLAEMSMYSSKAQEVSGKSLVLSEEDKTTVNTILEKYIILGIGSN
ncbi:MAG: hypothetical protein IKJ17_02125 [Clostridia bacterium]|nr:hypothetical protein [Clostridia bacterium]